MNEIWIIPTVGCVNNTAKSNTGIGLAKRKSNWMTSMQAN